MKKICILGMCLMIIMTASVFTGCSGQHTSDQTSSIVSSDVTKDSDLSSLEEQDSEIEIDEDDIEDPFG